MVYSNATTLKAHDDVDGDLTWAVQLVVERANQLVGEDECCQARSENGLICIKKLTGCESDLPRFIETRAPAGT
jgi:hypothetical protein